MLVSGLGNIRVVARVAHMVAYGYVLVVKVALLLVYPWITPRGQVATRIRVDVVHVAVRPHVRNLGDFGVHTRHLVYRGAEDWYVGLLRAFTAAKRTC